MPGWLSECSRYVPVHYFVVLMADAATVHRMPAMDTYIADTPPDAPVPLKIKRPKFKTSYHELQVPQVIRDEIWAAHVANHRGQTDALNVHSNLTRLKVAAALMVLDGRQAPILLGARSGCSAV